MRVPVLLASPFVLGCLFAAPAANATEPCTVPKSGRSGEFQIMGKATVTCPQGKVSWVVPSEPITAELDCAPSGGGSMTCNGYPMETQTYGKLSYKWTVTVGGVATTFPYGAPPTVTFSCPNQTPMSAKVWVKNGTYVSSKIVYAMCGQGVD